MTTDTPTTSLSTLVHLSPAFSAAVNIEHDFDNADKIGAYLPTRNAAQLLGEIAKSLHPTSEHRAHLIASSYGTGKSHLGLFLANFLRHKLEDGSPTARVVARLKSPAPEIHQLLTSRRAQLGRFLVVLRSGGGTTFNQSMLQGLRDALGRDSIALEMPKTESQAALDHIAEWENDWPTAYAEFEEAVLAKGHISVDAFKRRLRDFDGTAYHEFCEIHRQVSKGNLFEPLARGKAPKVYLDVARELREKHDYGGILVLYDEFGKHLENIVKDASGDDVLDIQNFAEACNASRDEQLHFVVLSHKGMSQYATDSSSAKKQSEDWKRVEGRFRHWSLKANDDEIYHFMDQVLVQQTETESWTHFTQDHFDRLAQVRDAAVEANLFPSWSSEEIERVIVHGCYPLHPAGVFCLPRLAEKVAQNERTTFTFLCTRGPRSLGAFLDAHAVGGRGTDVPFMTVEGIFDYFEASLEEDGSIRSEVLRPYRDAYTKVPPDDVWGKRIVKSVALLESVKSDRFRVTRQNLALCLDVRPEQRAAFDAALDRLSASRADARVLILAGDIYRFPQATGVDIPTLVKKVAEEQPFDLESFANARWNRGAEGLPDRHEIGDLDARDHNFKFKIDRTLKADFVSVDSLRSPKRFLATIEDNSVDGVALYVLCDTPEQIEEAEALAKGIEHPQVVVVIPNEPLDVAEAAQKLHAMQHLEETVAAQFGDGGTLRADFEAYLEDAFNSCAQRIQALTNPDKGQAWFRKGEAHPIARSAQARGFVDQVISEVFHSTPTFRHDSAMRFQRDRNAKHRHNVITHILSRSTLRMDLGFESKTSAESAITEAYLVKPGFLQLGADGQAVFGMPRDEATAEVQAARAIWGVLEAFVKKAGRSSPQSFATLVQTLMAPPFGLRERPITLLLAALFRQYIDNIEVQKKGSSGTPTQLDLRGDRVGTLIDELVKSPKQYFLVYLSHTERMASFAETLAAVFGDASLSGSKLLDGESLSKLVKSWYKDLPNIARTSQELSANALEFRSVITSKEYGPSQLYLDKLPSRLGFNLRQTGSVPPEENLAYSSKLTEVKDEIEALGGAIAKRMQALSLSMFAADEVVDPNPVRLWYEALPTWKRTHDWTRANRRAQTVLKWASESAQASTPAFDVLAEQLSEKPLSDWDEAQLARYEERLRSVLEQISLEEVEPPQPLPIQESMLIAPVWGLPETTEAVAVREAVLEWRRGLSSVNGATGDSARLLQWADNRVPDAPAEADLGALAKALGGFANLQHRLVTAKSALDNAVDPTEVVIIIRASDHQREGRLRILPDATPKAQQMSITLERFVQSMAAQLTTEERNYAILKLLEAQL